MNKLIAGIVMLSISTMALAQSGTNSPYSQYGLGDLADQSVGFNKGMNGVGLGMRKGNEVNLTNPASYSAIDSLTMIFDAGLSGQITKYEENGNRQNAKSGGFDYVVGLFRAFKNVGVSFGIMPYSNIGYKYATSSSLTDIQTTVASTYEGTGGIHQLFIGTGLRPVKPLSVGVNLSYLWGEYNRSVTTSSSSSINSLTKEYVATISNYKLDFGLQYEQKVGKNDAVTLGATWSPGHSLKADPECRVISSNSSISKKDTTTTALGDILKLPDTFGFGVAYAHAYNFRAGMDVQLQKWGGVSRDLKDNFRVNSGMEWTPRAMSRRFFDRLRYRAGIGYATPYYYINGKEGPKELSASIGLGIPIINAYNNRSILNISGQYVHRSANQLITENTFRINIGLTFNERWFAKWKVE